MKKSEVEILRGYRIARVKARHMFRHDMTSLKSRMQPESLLGEAAQIAKFHTVSKSKEIGKWSKKHPWPLVGVTGGILAFVFRRPLAKLAIRYATTYKIKQAKRQITSWLKTKGRKS